MRELKDSTREVSAFVVVCFFEILYFEYASYPSVQRYSILDLRANFIAIGKYELKSRLFVTWKSITLFLSRSIASHTYARLVFFCNK